MKSKLDYKFSNRQRLPHIQPKGATFLVTSRLEGSLPIEVVRRLGQERDKIDHNLEKIANQREHEKQSNIEYQQLFAKWDDALDTLNAGVLYLSDPRIANVVFESLHYWDGKVYELISFCFMPDHLHIVFTPLREAAENYYSLSKIMRSSKRHTARKANLILGRTGPFWQHENSDHFIRDGAELERTIKYVLYNPVNAHLVKEQRDWKWSYCKYEI